MKRDEKCTVFVCKNDSKVNVFKVKIQKAWIFTKKMEKKRNVSHCAIVLPSIFYYEDLEVKPKLTPLDWKVGDIIELTGLSMSF
jgi:hypothetical protein